MQKKESRNPSSAKASEKNRQKSRKRKKPDPEKSPEANPFLILENEFPSIRRKLLTWFEKNSRSYPWRNTDNWFHMLMAEMMLRRTRADQVLPVYRAFTEKFRTPRDAFRRSSEIPRLLQPLGMKWRAKQTIHTVRHLKDNMDVRNLPTAETLMQTPGIGSYSGAMLQNRFNGLRKAAVDSNVVRFFARLSGIAYNPELRRKKSLIQAADAFMDHRESFSLNLAILDFSSAVCRPKKPQCYGCIFQSLCRTGRNSQQSPM